jgi:hypothetical protein
VLRVL